MEGHHDLGQVTRAVEDLATGQFPDLAGDAPTFDVPPDFDPDSQIAALDTGRHRLLYPKRGGGEGVVEAPELKRLSERRHDERCLVTTGEDDPRGYRTFFLVRVER